jgi:hypothetical protein
MYVGNEWAGEANTKRELVAWADRMVTAHTQGLEIMSHMAS